jgi:hypothetical protein
VAFVALKHGPLPRLFIRKMGVLMQIEIVQICEPVRTEMTPVLNFTMRSNMLDKLGDKLEEMSAAGHGAAVAFLTQMGAEVGSILGILFESLRTKRAFIIVLNM